MTCFFKHFQHIFTKGENWTKNENNVKITEEGLCKANEGAEL